MKLKKNEHGVYEASFKTTKGKSKTVSTKCTNHKDAKKVVKDAGIEEMELSAKTGRLSREVIGHILTGGKLTVSQALGEYLRWMQISGKATKSIGNVSAYLTAWIRDMNIGRIPPSAVTEEQIDSWINQKEASTKASTRTVKLSNIKCFLEFCLIRGWVVGNPAKLVRVRYDIMDFKQKEPNEKPVFTPEEVKRIAADCEKKERIFWAAATQISYEVGLRLGDICQLEWASFYRPGKIIVWTDKRDKRVAVPISEELSNLISTLPLKHQLYVFPEERAAIKDTEVDRRATLSMAFKRICENLGINGKSFHNLRHTCITRWAKEGKTLEDIGELVGHSNSHTTQGYVH